MIEVRLAAESMARVRLACSPVQEALKLLALTASGRRHPLFGDPGAAARDALSRPEVALVAAVTQPDGTGYTPDLLTPKPPPGRDRTVLEDQLALVAATPQERMVEEVAVWRFGAGRIPGNVLGAVEAGTFAAQAAAGLAAFWRAAMADSWPAIRSTLDTDLSRRAESMARNGVGQVLGELHPRLTFDRDRLRFASRFDEVCELLGEELVLTPSALGWPALSLQTCSPGNAMITYPARGLADRRDTGQGMTGLLGASRARILADLDVPRSTAELSRRHSLAPATVSYHLGVMFRAGLLVRSRDGHQVRYRRNANGWVSTADTQPF